MARLVTKFKYLKPDQDFTKASMCGRVHAYLWDTNILAGAIRSKSQNMYMFALLASIVPNSGQDWLYRKSDYPEYFKESQ